MVYLHYDMTEAMRCARKTAARLKAPRYIVRTAYGLRIESKRPTHVLYQSFKVSANGQIMEVR